MYLHKLEYVQKIITIHYESWQQLFSKKIPARDVWQSTNMQGYR